MSRKHRLRILSGQIVLIMISLPTFIQAFVLLRLSPIFAGLLLINGFVFLGVALLLETVAYEKLSESQILDRQKHEPTNEAKKLREALKERGIYSELEHFNGFKSVDIFIPRAKLYLEVDGDYHYKEEAFWFRDLKRDLYSHKAGRGTIHIPNRYVENNLAELADVIAEIIGDEDRTNLNFVFKQLRKLVAK